MSGEDNGRIVAIANQKGGVGKTTTAVNLAAALVDSGHRVLLIDLDPQGNASTGLGSAANERRATIYDVLAGDVGLADATTRTSIQSLDLLPASRDLVSAELEFSERKKRVQLLKRAIRRPEGYDYILIDCPPALGLLTVNALVAADSVMVPLQSEFYALEGLSQLLLSIKDVRSTANPDLRLNGVVLTMFDRRNNLAVQVEADARATLGDLVYKTKIPRNVRISEAPSHGLPVLSYDRGSLGAKAYIDLSREFVARQKELTS